MKNRGDHPSNSFHLTNPILKQYPTACNGFTRDQPFQRWIEHGDHAHEDVEELFVFLPLIFLPNYVFLSSGHLNRTRRVSLFEVDLVIKSSMGNDKT